MVAFVVGHGQEVAGLQHFLVQLAVDEEYFLGDFNQRLLVVFAVGLLGGEAELERVAGVFAVELAFKLFGQAAVAKQKHHGRIGFG